MADQENDPDSLLNYYRAALKLRKELAVVKTGSYKDLRPLSPKLHVYERCSRGKRLLVICSYSDKPMSFRAPRGYELKKGKLLLKSHGGQLRGNGFTMQPYESRVYYFEDKRRSKRETD